MSKHGSKPCFVPDLEFCCCLFFAKVRVYSVNKKKIKKNLLAPLCDSLEKLALNGEKGEDMLRDMQVAYYRKSSQHMKTWCHLCDS